MNNEGMGGRAPRLRSAGVAGCTALALALGAVVGVAAPASAHSPLPAAVRTTHSDQDKSSKVEKFVERVYKSFLGRHATDEEKAFWVDAISSGSATRDQLTQQLATSEEWVKRIIKGFYKDTLGREPDKAGLDYWVGVARGGYPLEKIASEFYGSSEYFGGMAHESREQWVKDMYFKLMFRDADEDGVAYWLGELRRGVKRAVIAHSFYQSDEKLGLRVWTLYKAFLGHDPDKAGMEYWKGVVQARGDLVLATWLAASDEYYEGGKGWHR